MGNDSGIAEKYFIRIFAVWMTGVIIWVTTWPDYTGFNFIAYIVFAAVYLGAAWEFYRDSKENDANTDSQIKSANSEISNLKDEISKLKKKTTKRK